MKTQYLSQLNDKMTRTVFVALCGLGALQLPAVTAYAAPARTDANARFAQALSQLEAANVPLTKNGVGASSTFARRAEWTTLLKAVRAGATNTTTAGHEDNAISLAALAGRDDVLRALMARGFRSSSPQFSRFAPLENATEFGHLTTVKLLLNSAHSVAQGENGQALHRAARNGHISVVNLLLAQGVGAGKPDSAGWTPLHWLAAVGPSATNKALRRSGANNYQVAELLLTKKAPVDTALPTGQTPLFIAAVSGRADLTKLFLAHKAKPEPKDNLGGTPLHKAARNGNTEVVRLLLAHGAKANVRDLAGWTPLHWLAAVGPTASKDELRRSGTENFAAAKLLLTSGAQIETALPTGQTPLFVAAVSGRADLVRLLLSRGAKPNPIDDQGRTPLDRATAPEVRSLLGQSKN